MIDEKPPKLDEETRRKTDYLYVIGVKNLRNLAKKTVEENLILIEDKNETSGSKLKHNIQIWSSQCF